MHSNANSRGTHPSSGRTLVVTLVGALALFTITPTLRGQAREETAIVEADGTLEVLVEDYTGGSRLVHFLQTPAGRLRLEFPGEPPALLTGTPFSSVTKRPSAS